MSLGSLLAPVGTIILVVLLPIGLIVGKPPLFAFLPVGFVVGALLLFDLLLVGLIVSCFLRGDLLPIGLIVGTIILAALLPVIRVQLSIRPVKFSLLFLCKQCHKQLLSFDQPHM